MLLTGIDNSKISRHNQKIQEVTIKKLIWVFLLIISAVSAFAQASALRDYVGVVHQSYHPDVIAYLNKLKSYYQKQGQDDVVKNIDNFLKGGFGSGFVYVDSNGNNYIITNNHVIRKAYTVSIEFEKQDGTKTVYDGLSLLAADEDMDIALLAFPPGIKPFTAGLALASQSPDDGDDVFSAGFPGAVGEAIWQFGRGSVSNALVRLPAVDEFDKALGPYIQHTAQVDGGNSGGPLLVAWSGVPTGYAVVGINTLSIRGRQAANYAIPVSRVVEFINAISAKKTAEHEREKLDAVLAAFIAGLSAPKAVYPHIAAWLSNEYAAANAEFAISEVEDKANNQARDDIFSQSLFTAMDCAVGWLIETDFRTLNKGGVLRPTLGDITRNEDGSYTVVLIFNGNRTIETVWTNQYGAWKLGSAGGRGDSKALMAEKEQQAETDKKLRTDLTFAVSAGYAFVGERKSALDLAFKFNAGLSHAEWGFHAFIKDTDFSLVEFTAGFNFLIKTGTHAALLPYLDFGFGAMFHEADPTDPFSSKYSLGVSAQAGVMVTTTVVTGLFVKAAYQFNYYDGLTGSRGIDLPDTRHSGIIGVGYLF
ncbi:hypothetical protein FACS1894130_02730 [Spirochaetia bacterium]|nr:hypothetical protein FACS1894130_02730 [Spirochaetia bacterium]